MRGRTVGKIVVGFVTVLFVVLCYMSIRKASDPDRVFEGARAIAYAILALTAATFYRYFED